MKVRPKAQLTLPEEIRRALHISEVDEVEFSVYDDGTITVRGYVSIPTDQAWFFTPQWLAGEREADEDIAAGPAGDQLLARCGPPPVVAGGVVYAGSTDGLAYAIRAWR